MVMSTIHGESNEDTAHKEDKVDFLSQLPGDIVELILAHIFTSDPGALGLIRSVCKDWSSITRPPTTSLDLGRYKSPYLVTLVDSTCKFFHPAYNHTFDLETPELMNAHIRSSNFGWLLLSRYLRNIHEFEYFFFNPFTREKKHLPNINMIGFTTMCFSSPPTSSDCYVLGISHFGFELAITRYGEDMWEFIEYQNPRKQRVSYCHPVFYKEKFYCFGADLRLIVVDVHTKKIIVVGETFVEELGEVERCSLVEDEEGLLGIFFLTQRQVPVVMRMNLSQTKKVWQVVHKLENKIVYTSPTASWSDLAPTKSTSNKIYFPLFQDSNNIFFSLSTNNYHAFTGNYSCSGIPCGAERMTNCAWISIEKN